MENSPDHRRPATARQMAAMKLMIQVSVGLGCIDRILWRIGIATGCLGNLSFSPMYRFMLWTIHCRNTLFFALKLNPTLMCMEQRWVIYALIVWVWIFQCPSCATHSRIEIVDAGRVAPSALWYCRWRRNSV